MSIITPAINFYRGRHSTYANGDGEVLFSNFDVDELASSRTSKNTYEQTKWGVKLFRSE